MKKIAIIPARSGSKGLPNKNVLLANGKPLIGYSIEAALDSQCFEKIVVSTDSQEYIDLLSHYPVEFVKRDEQLSTDKATSFVVVKDILNKYQNIAFDYFVLLQPTSPLRTAQHIKESCEKFEEKIEFFDFLVSVSMVHKPTGLTCFIDDDCSLKHFQLDYSNYTRQKYQPEYSPNGAIFSAKPSAYLNQKHFYGEKSLAYFMEKSVSIDIDDRLDFEYFYFVLQQKNKNKVLRKNIQNRIQQKKHSFSEMHPITFIGHSILDNWHIDNLNGLTIGNLGVSGISTSEYIDLFDAKLIKHIGNQVVLMHGTNDIVKPDWTKESILSQIQLLIHKIKEMNSSCYVYFLEITPIALRVDRNNQEIRELNYYLKNNLDKVEWVDLYQDLCDEYGKLNLDYTGDGLHLNQCGYQVLQSIVEKALLT